MFKKYEIRTELILFVRSILNKTPTANQQYNYIPVLKILILLPSDHSAIDIHYEQDPQTFK